MTWNVPSSSQIKLPYFLWKYQSCKELSFWKIQASWSKIIKWKESSDFFASFFVICKTPTEFKISIYLQYFIKTEKHSTKHRHTNYIKYSLYHQWVFFGITVFPRLGKYLLILDIPVIQILPDHMTVALVTYTELSLIM